ncbi:hypothetical protein EMCG_06726 [[Emmonsia] crescens]|uniref:Uncharacterized protein n=1 Tax=[Emmonsia] crescens TaxID=73230 RepID=A0A0G2JBL0_9EURO|nr:hypothetical protein EMCG_06726 [Emmonsia crescens UAMH 3008]
MASQQMPKYLNARALAEEHLPNLKFKTGNCTTTVALHNIYFTGKIQSWKSFKNEVISFISQVELKETVLSYQTIPREKDINFIEYFCCGDESSVSARFISQVLHAVLAISEKAGFTSVFGDYRAAADARTKKKTPQGGDNGSKGKDRAGGNNGNSERQKRFIPDYVLMSDEGRELRLVGEAKTPWKHPLEQWCRSFEKQEAEEEKEEEEEEDQKGGDNSFRHALGQIAQYMQGFKLKYAFLTTYHQTIFLKQEGTKDDAVLFYSQVIHHSDTEPSLRECILYMQSLVEQSKDSKKDSTPWNFENEVGSDGSEIPWIVKRNKDKDLEENVDDFKYRVKKALEKVSDFQKKLKPQSHLESISAGLKKMTISHPGDHGDEEQEAARTLKVGSRGVTFANP